MYTSDAGLGYENTWVNYYLQIYFIKKENQTCGYEDRPCGNPEENTIDYHRDFSRESQSKRQNISFWWKFDYLTGEYIGNTSELWYWYKELGYFHYDDSEIYV